jgi:hypothetical protein
LMFLSYFLPSIRYHLPQDGLSTDIH